MGETHELDDTEKATANNFAYCCITLTSTFERNDK